MNMVNLTLNGKPAEAECEPRTHLADFIRDTHNLTGTHIGCEHGVCGACTVLVDGVPTRSCITFAASCERAAVTTVEGLDSDEIATELRTAFSREHGLQCGYCTPGMLISARDVVMRMQNPTEHDIRVVMSGNLCRCTGYVGIIRAIQNVIVDRRARGIDAVPDGGRNRLGPAGSGNADATAQKDRKEAITGKGSEKPAVSAAVAAFRKDSDWTPQTTLEQHFVVNHPPEVVWDFFGNVDEVATCLPGASLIGEPVGKNVEGKIKVKIGPISAEFQGVAEIERNDAQHAGMIEGAGKDKRSNSTTRGRIIYKVKEGGTAEEAEVDVTIGFTLTGVLAQFSRSGLVQDVANRIIGAFVENLEAKLTHQAEGGSGELTPVAAEFNAGSLMFAVIFGRIKRFFAWIFQHS